MVSYIEENLIGVHVARLYRQSTFSWAGIIYNSVFYDVKNRFLQSFFASKTYYNIKYSGELAMQDINNWAILQKLNISVSDNSLFTLQYRSRKDSLFNEYKSDYSSFNNGYENGVYCAFQHNINEKWLFRIVFDYFESNSVRSTEPYKPKGRKVLSQILRQSEQREFTIQYQYKNIENAEQINKLRLFQQKKLSNQIRWNTKLKLIKEWGDKNSSLESNFYWRSLNENNKDNFSFCLFNTKTESIYWQPPYFYGNFNSKFLFGKGNVTSLSLQKKIVQSLKTGIQINQIIYHDRELIGSGNDMIIGNSKLDISAYLKWKN